MELGTIYYISTVLEGIVVFFIFLMVGSAVVVLVIIACAITSLEDMKKSEIKTIKITLKISVLILFISSIFALLVPRQNQFLKIMAANYIDENVIRNEELKKWSLKKIDLIDKKIDEFLKEK